MIFTSTRNNNIQVSFSQAVKQCFPEDGGVFVPALSSFEDLRKWTYYIDKDTSFSSIAGTLTSAFMREEFSPIICEKIATEAFPFEPVITQLDENLFHLELFHGYTGCHRDFGVSYLCSYLETTNQLLGRKSVFVDFTHGELGTLLAKVLKGKKNLKAVMLYKKGTVQGLHEEDFIWNGGNILPVEVEGSENQIKAMVSSLFSDKSFVEDYNLTLANTTNVCRLMSQVFYFPYAFAQIKNKISGDIYYALDSGNYAMLIAGLYSWRFAFPLNGFYLPSTNELCVDSKGNPVILDSFVSMDKKGDVNPIKPANLERLESFFGKNELMIRSFIYPCDISEKKREKAAKELFINYGLFSDPGTASSYAVIKEKSSEVFDDDGAFVLVSQNHPALNSEYCRHVLGETPEMPENIAENLKPTILHREMIKSKEELQALIKKYI